jgi:hypothetical protein
LFSFIIEHAVEEVEIITTTADVGLDGVCKS